MSIYLESAQDMMPSYVPVQEEFSVETVPVVEQPAVIIPGVRKCGTTTLFDLLSQHTAIAPSIIKEPQFFSLAPETVSSHLPWYRSLFPANSDKYLLDGSTLCFGNPLAPEMIKRHLPHSKVVMIIRDPAKRAYSSFLHANKKTPCDDNRTFQDILSSLTNAKLDCTLAEAEDTLIQQAIADGKVNGNIYGKDFLANLYSAPFETNMPDPLFPYRYFHESEYSKRVGAYRNVFRDSMKIVFFEELMTKPTEIVREILTFLGLEFEEDSFSMKHENQTTVPKSKLSRYALEFQQSNQYAKQLTQLLRKMGLQSLGRQVKQRLLHTSPPKLSEENYNLARNLLASEYNYWGARYPKLNSLWKYG